LKGYDYTLPGAYFVTLVAATREPLWNDPERAGESQFFRQDHRRLLATPARFILIYPPDEWVIMPNHFMASFVIAHAIRMMIPPK